MSSTQHIPDLRTYAFHQKAAEILRAHPERLQEVKDTLAHWMTMPGTQAKGWAEKWQDMIRDLSAPEVADLICEKSELMDFYRKSSPFACLLSNEQRLEILLELRFDHE